MQGDMKRRFDALVENGGYRLDDVEGLTPEHLYDRLLKMFIEGSKYAREQLTGVLPR